MKTLSINLIKVVGRLFCSEKKEAKENKKRVSKRSGFNAPKLYHSVYEDLTLEQQLIISQMYI